MADKEYQKLHAEWYEFASAQVDHTKEVDFIARCIEASPGPVLELGSGTGRVLIPLLERGFDICGIDTSKPMLERCHALCHSQDLKPQLYEQSMLDFDLPQRFGAILLVSGSLSLFLADQDIHSTCERVMTYLKPGGLFIYGFELPPPPGNVTDDGTWSGDWLLGPDDVVIAWRKRHKYDAATNTWQQLFIVEKYINGRLVETEANQRVGRSFSVAEAVQFAESAGFTAIETIDWQTERPPTRDAGSATILCRKPV